MGRDQPKHPSDNDLLCAIERGDPMALRLLMDRYDRLVRYTIYRASRQRCQRDPLWLDSVASEVWTDLCRSSRSRGHREVANPASYFIQIARRRCIDALRRRSNVPLATGGTEGLDQLQPTSDQEDTVDLLANMEELAALRTCMQQLTDTDRRLCGELGAITAGRWKEASQRLTVPESTLRSRWKGVLASLRLCLEKKRETPRV
jgi:DNA-directed RNA polymerase specialized sigma24 family protein